MPPVLAGREEELARANSLLRQLADGETPAQDLLLYGPRGNGKTALLARIADHASQLGMRAERLPVAELDSKASLMRALQERTAPIARVTGVSVGTIGVTTEPAALPATVDSLLPTWIQRDAAPLVVLFDEVHAIAPDAGRAFFDAVQTVKTDGLPFLLVAAGTPDAPRRIRDMGTHNERAFDQIRIGRLARIATLAALTEPVSNLGVPMTPEAAQALAEASQDYPYFVQLLGSAAWDAAERNGSDRLTGALAREGLARARPRIESFYGERFREAQRRGVDGALTSLAARFLVHDGVLPDPKLEPTLRDLAEQDDFPEHWTRLREELEDLGVIWEVSPGRWEMGIPSFAEHVMRRVARDGTGRGAPR